MFTSVILAAGMGTRMKSKMPKVLHKVCGKPLSKWVIRLKRLKRYSAMCANLRCRLNKKVQVTQLCKLSTL